MRRCFCAQPFSKFTLFCGLSALQYLAVLVWGNLRRKSISNLKNHTMNIYWLCGRGTAKNTTLFITAFSDGTTGAQNTQRKGACLKIKTVTGSQTTACGTMAFVRQFFAQFVRRRLYIPVGYASLCFRFRVMFKCDAVCAG